MKDITLSGNDAAIHAKTKCLSLADVSLRREHSLFPLGNSHPIVSYTLWVATDRNPYTV